MKSRSALDLGAADIVVHRTTSLKIPMSMYAQLRARNALLIPIRREVRHLSAVNEDNFLEACSLFFTQTKCRSNIPSKAFLIKAKQS